MSASSSPLASVVGPSHIALEVSDLERSLAFYQRVLGLEIFYDERQTGTPPSIKGIVAGFAIELGQIHLPPGSGNPSQVRPQAGAPCMAFTIEDAVGAHGRLKAEGVSVESAVKEIQGVKFFYVYDPDGYPFELIEFPLGARALADLRAYFDVTSSG
ncbi:VOC family protein [Caulobacter segnis]|uniref:Glyoxalase/bleomycin resistance protein/dioxygenase n=1 Tax=Caulobacter segnis (strain ATCC 21756 / DSM 7131 / JCM 7823 / NBRC 15250 / LMG 17158 / TK0059) TaxID=509190 RepID=D5VLU8_CAUST|nr:VOC family protein [Caulobacter segnis]ADG11471.1 Glyoxalase/bleomycin resistance protein/dioxygenase [Caulobacter segnis ATCC 21756]